MKRYIKSSFDYQSMFSNVVRFFKEYVKNRSDVSYASYNDYRVIPDDLGSGIAVELQWDGDLSEKDLSNDIRDRFYFVTCNKSFGKFDHQITVHIPERVFK